MFTVKTRNHNGNENVFTASRVEYIDKITEGEEGFIQPGVIVYYNGGGSTHYEVNGSVRHIWVMNSQGATVASYIF